MGKYSSDREKWRLQKRAQRDRIRNQGQTQQPQQEEESSEEDFWLH